MSNYSVKGYKQLIEFIMRYKRNSLSIKSNEKTTLFEYKSMFLPVLLYRGENWILTEKRQERLQDIEMKFLSKVLEVRWIGKWR